jgi:hypothetical protein
MHQTTRDNLIYLAVGIGIAALVVADFFYADSHGRAMWMPSNFAIRAVAYIAILGYFVARETRKAKATLFQVTMCVLAAGILHLGIVYAFRETISGRFSIGLWALAVLEFFLIVQLMVYTVHYLRSRSQRTHRG